MRIQVILLATALTGSVAFAPAASSSGGEQAQDEGTGSDGFTLVENEAGPAGAYPRPGLTERVSVASDGAEANQRSFAPSVSADGRFVAFHSAASNLVQGDTNGADDVFVHDRTTGTTQRVSVATDGSQGSSNSHSPSISADGRYVAFSSSAREFVPDGTLSPRVFVHDRETGVTEPASVAADGTPAIGHEPSISADGRYVAFRTISSSLVQGGTNGSSHIFVRDREAQVTEQVSVASDGAEGTGGSYFPAVSGDGQHVAFYSVASNLVADDTNDAVDVFVRDRQAGTTERVSVGQGNLQANGDHLLPGSAAAISVDGRYVAFHSFASNLVPADVNGVPDVFVRDRVAGVTERVSVASDGVEGDLDAYDPAISADGRHVVFYSWASNLVAGSSGGSSHAYVRDRVAGVTERVSVAPDGASGNIDSYAAAVSADGRHIAFYSWASNLVAGDTNGWLDVFVRDRGVPTGVGDLSVVPHEDGLTFSGWATLSGQVVTAADAPSDGDVHQAAGSDLTGASITYRPEGQDLLVRLSLSSLPAVSVGSCATYGLLGCTSAEVGAGVPGIVYGSGFELDGTRYEVRALRAATTAVPPTGAEPHFALYECAPDCVETARMSGGIGTSGPEVTVALPLDVLGAAEGATLSDVSAWTAIGDAAVGGLVVVDQVDLPDAAIPVSRIELGTAPPSASQGDVAFTTQVDLIDGRFSGIMNASDVPGGPYRIWARACLGSACGAHSMEVAP